MTTVGMVREMARKVGLSLTSRVPPRCKRCSRYMRRRRVSYFGGPRMTWRCGWCDEQMAKRERLP